MKTKVFLGIALRVIALFTVAILATYLPDYLHEVLDYKTGSGNWDYTARHYWFNILMALLFILSLINVIIGTVNIVRKNYDTKKW